MKAALAFLIGVGLMFGVATVGQFQTALVITEQMKLARELRAQCQTATLQRAWL